MTKKEAVKNELLKELYDRSFFEFFQDALKLIEPGTNFDINWHHEILANRLQEEVERIIKKEKRKKHLIINVPFRSTKSLMVSVCLPVWGWIKSGDLSFINLSYSAGLSTDASNKVVELLHHPKMFMLYKFDLEDNQRAKTNFKLKGRGGYRISSGFGGAVLGKGADIIILDDPNNPKELSEVGVKNTIRTWKDTISTRLNQPEIGLYIVIQQRLHHNDLSGYLLKNFEDEWEKICLPAELTENTSPEYVKYYINGLLWPTRFNSEVLAKYELSLGSEGYSNQLLQEATSTKGNIIKKDWIKIIDAHEFYSSIAELKHKPKVCCFLDSGYRKNKENDPSGFLITILIDNTTYVLKAYSVRKEFPDLIEFIKQLYVKHGIKIMYVEPKASGISIVQQIKKSTRYAITELSADKDDKETCLRSVSPLIEAGNLVLVEDVSNSLVIDQLTKFPKAANDEMVDLVYYALKKSGVVFNYAMP